MAASIWPISLAYVGAGGTASVNKNRASKGETITVTLSPSSGYTALKPTATGITFTSAGTNKWSFVMPDAPVEITIVFGEITYAINVTNAGGNGNYNLSKNRAGAGSEVTIQLVPNSGYTANTPTATGITFTSAGANTWRFTMPSHDIEITTKFTAINYTVSKTASPAAGGTVSLSKTTAHVNDEITITATPATGYRIKSITTSPVRTITNNKFTMPAGNVAVTVTFEKVVYTVSGSASPAAGGTVSLGKSTAYYGDAVTVSQTPAAGYYFNGWTKTPANLTISSGMFTMPAQNVVLVANYLKYSTATLSTRQITGGGTVKLTINADKSTFTHKYRLNMGTNMDTGWVNVAANVREVTVSVPDSWSNQIPNAIQKTGGTMKVRTYNGSTLIGEYTISNVTYIVRADALPTLQDITASIVRTVNGTTYANVGDYYVQRKCAVRVQDTAAGALGSTITKIEVMLSGYSTAAYKTTVLNSNSVDWTSGLLSIKGTCTITVKATDSRGRTVTKTTTITVYAYSKPRATLAVWRVDANGDDDVLGQYGKYRKTSSYTAVGSNTMTVTLTCQGTTETNPANSGNLMPSSRKTFDALTEYTVTLVVADSFETTTITKKLPSAQFMIFVNANGDRLGLMRATNENLSKNGKAGTIELSEYHQIYVGSVTLEQFIRNNIGAGTAPNGTDLNTMVTPGFYLLDTTFSYTNMPPESHALIVAKTSDTWTGVMQIAVSVYGLHIRFRVNANDWSNWNKIDNQGYGWQPDGTDIDNLLKPGTYGLYDNLTYLGLPTGETGGILEVIAPSRDNYYLMQILRPTAGRFYVRYRSQNSGADWNIWYKFTGTAV